jgi:hypothetical protein
MSICFPVDSHGICKSFRKSGGQHFHPLHHAPRHCQSGVMDVSQALCRSEGGGIAEWNSGVVDATPIRQAEKCSYLHRQTAECVDVNSHPVMIWALQTHGTGLPRNAPWLVVRSDSTVILS